MMSITTQSKSLIYFTVVRIYRSNSSVFLKGRMLYDSARRLKKPERQNLKMERPTKSERHEVLVFSSLSVATVVQNDPEMSLEASITRDGTF